MATNDWIQNEWEWAEGFVKNVGRPPRLFAVDRVKTALVIIDMQNAFLRSGATLESPAGREVVPNVNKLTTACREAGIPVIWVVSKFRSEAEWGLISRFEPGSPVGTERKTPMQELAWGDEGTDIWPELEVDAERDYEVVKTRYSALVSGSSNLERLLRTLGREHLILAGVSTSVCVGATVMDAMMLDFKVTVAADATASKRDFLQQAFLITFKVVFADVVTTAEIVEEITQVAQSRVKG